MTEVAYKTGLDLAEAIDVLDQLEEQGLVTPYTWALGPEASR